MMIRYWNPIEEADTLRHQLDRLFEGMMDADPSSAPHWTPAIDLRDEGDVLVFKTFLPGVKAEDLDVQVTRASLSISGHRHPSKQAQGTRQVYSDIPYGPFRRATKLPIAVKNTEVEASFEQGILTLTLPKVEAEQNKVVKVTLSGSRDSSQPTVDANQGDDVA